MFVCGLGGHIGKDSEAAAPKGTAETYGFLKLRLNGGVLCGTYYYTTDLVTWATWESPKFDLIKGGQVPKEYSGVSRGKSK